MPVRQGDLNLLQHPTPREYSVAAERYFGREQGQAWVAQLGTMLSTMVRITITPEWTCWIFRRDFPVLCRFDPNPLVSFVVLTSNSQWVTVPNENSVQPYGGCHFPERTAKLKQFADLLESGERHSRMHTWAREPVRR